MRLFRERSSRRPYVRYSTESYPGVLEGLWGRRYATVSSGIRDRASSQEQSNEIETTLKMSAVYSPTADSARKIGRKAAAVVREEVRRGTAISPPAATAASTAPSPRSRLTRTASAITMALSTSSPREMIRAARDIWLTVMPKKPITENVAKIAAGTSMPTISPVRRPRNSSITTTTITMAWSRLSRKFPTPASTTAASR